MISCKPLCNYFVTAKNGFYFIYLFIYFTMLCGHIWCKKKNSTDNFLHNIYALKMYFHANKVLIVTFLKQSLFSYKIWINFKCNDVSTLLKLMIIR